MTYVDGSERNAETCVIEKRSSYGDTYLFFINDSSTIAVFMQKRRNQKMVPESTIYHWGFTDKLLILASFRPGCHNFLRRVIEIKSHKHIPHSHFKFTRHCLPCE